jgi:anti-sigma regulatory factor (Ser/Thr protein kinase)
LRVGQHLIALDRFVTLCYARFDLDRNCLEFVDCGHTGIVLYRRATGEVRMLRGDDLPLGVLPDFECAQQSVPVMPGDTFLLFSDGVTEMPNAEGDFFGEERLIECVRDWSSLGPDILLEKIRETTAEFSGNRGPADDFTCIVLQVRLSEDAPAALSRSAEFPRALEALAGVREWILTAAGPECNGGLDEGDLSRVELACTEAFVNCVLHGTQGDPAEKARITTHSWPGHFRVDIGHEGPEFDPLRAPAPSFDGSRDGGFGVWIIIHSADEVSYSREGGTNLLSMSFLAKRDNQCN